ncbi:MAG TPA: DUF1990 domain-containing protein, partial [Saprospiraceae bacterium]|nr:DUF1990 domain-containing protein [Saprospiraceae bacterium]
DVLSKNIPLKMLSKPAETRMRAFIESEKDRSFTYRQVGQTRTNDRVPGFNNDFNFIELGRGEAVWQAAKAAVRQWKMFPGGWACIFPDDTPIREGEIVAMSAQVLGLWWLNSCRIVYVIDNEQQFGFAYGTLPGHAECGEELFMVEKTADGTVRYVLKAFSKPRFWLARLGYPIARMYQRKFVRDSKQFMLAFVQYR